MFAETGLPDARVAEIIAAKAEGLSVALLASQERRAAAGLPAVSGGSAEPARAAGVSSTLVSILATRPDPFDVRLLVDVTAAEEMGDLLAGALEEGWGVVLANKLPLVGPLPLPYTQRLMQEAGSRLRYEATVGAGLPVIRTLRALQDTGDVVHNVAGCLSGTLGFLAHRLEQGQPFSASVREALALGYTEPDPRQDLSGMDVARKALIMARTMGQELELCDVEVEPLFPVEMASLSLSEFLEALERLDDECARRVSAARARGQVLRYAASVGSDGCRVGLQEAGPDDPMASLRGPDNLVRFRTERYDSNPLVIVGPGAGPECTAGGVLADILDLAVRSG
jgi:homoserine dehydrogenase